MTKPFLIGGASMPRSGHHFMHRILMSYFGEKFGYCSYYYPWQHDFFPACCKNIPCSKYVDTGLEVFFQKSHDFDLTDPVGAADLNLVQIREPIGRLFSNFELHVKNNPKHDTKAYFRQFALRDYYYYVAFWQKWVANTQHQPFVITYEDLKETPVEAVTQLLKATGNTVDEIRIRAAVQEQKASRGGQAKYVPRDIRQHKYYDGEWVEEYSNKLLRACEGFHKFYDR